MVNEEGGTTITPQTYHTTPEPLEQTRCLLVRAALSALLTGIWLVTGLLPKGHPTRIFLRGRLPELREVLLPAVIPSSRPDLAAVASHRRLWIGALALLGFAVIGDISAAIPFDPFGLPDVDLGLKAIIGADSLVDTPHILSKPLPWEEASRVGFGLLTACACALYAMRPRRATVID